MKRMLGLVLFVLALPSSTQAQVPAWAQEIKLGKPLFLTTAAGERIEGVAGQVTPDAILVATPVGVRSVPYRELRRAEKRDALWTGAAIGAGVSAGVSFVVIATNADCTTDHCRSENAAAVIGGAIYGGLIGWGLDALVKGKTTVFDSDMSVRVGMAPKRGGLSAGVTFNW